MPMYEEPVVGAFYEDREEDSRRFEVIAFDENDGTVEIQYSDGSTDEIDLDDWYGMDLERQESDEAGNDEDDGNEVPETGDDIDEDDDIDLDDEEEE